MCARRRRRRRRTFIHKQSVGRRVSMCAYLYGVYILYTLRNTRAIYTHNKKNHTPLAALRCGARRTRHKNCVAMCARFICVCECVFLYCARLSALLDLKWMGVHSHTRRTCGVLRAARMHANIWMNVRCVCAHVCYKYTVHIIRCALAARAHALLGWIGYTVHAPTTVAHNAHTSQQKPSRIERECVCVCVCGFTGI